MFTLEGKLTLAILGAPEGREIPGRAPPRLGLLALAPPLASPVAHHQLGRGLLPPPAPLPRPLPRLSRPDAQRAGPGLFPLSV